MPSGSATSMIALRAASRELIDELVDPGRADGPGRGADDELPPRQPHSFAGMISWSEPSSCLR